MDTSTQEADILSCSICLETMKEPKVLPCLHRLCESCLNVHITVSTVRNAIKPAGFSCPECRRFIMPVMIGSPPSTWAAQFNTDFMIKGLTELYANRQELNKDNKQHINHPCPEHTNTEVGLYCVDCSKTVCHLCAATSHEKCDRLVAVKKAAQGHRSRLQEKIRQIQPIVDGALEREKVRERYMTEVNTNVMLADKEIREFAEKVHELVNEQTEHLLNELHTNYEDLQQNVSVDVSKLTEDINNLQDLVKIGKLKLTNNSDLDLFLDTSFNADIDSCKKQTVGLNQHYDSLCKKISNVQCRFMASKSPCVSLGNILFLSDIKGSIDLKPLDSQSSKFTPRLTSSQTSGVNFGSIRSPTSLQASLGSMSIPSGLQTSLGSMSSPSGLQTSLGSMSSPSGLQTSLRSMSSPSGLQTSLGSMSSPSGLQTSLGSMSSPSGLQTSLGSMSSPSGLQTSLGSMSSPSGLQTSLGSMSSPSGLQTSLGSMPAPSNLQASLGSISSPSNLQTSLGSMPSPSSLQTSMFTLASMLSPSSLQTSMFSLASMPSTSGSQSSHFTLSLRPSTSGRLSPMLQECPVSTNHFQSANAHYPNVNFSSPFEETFDEFLRAEKKRKKKKRKYHTSHTHF